MNQPTSIQDAEISNEMAEAGAAVLRFHLAYEENLELNEGRLEQMAREVFVAMRAVLEARDGAP